MNRDDLGKMLQKQEEIVNWNEWAHGQEWTDIIFQNAAEGFWNDAIEELRSRMEYQQNIMRELIREPYEWLEDQKIKED